MINRFLSFNKKLKDFVVGPEGNASLRRADSFYIKASGVSMAAITEQEIFECDLYGVPINHTSGRPSMETGFHSWLYRNLNINAIAHTHPTNTMKVICSNKVYDFANNRLFPDQVVFNGRKSCIVEYAQPGKELESKLAFSIEEYMEEMKQVPRLILLKNHGIITLGLSEQECIVSTMICEKASEIFLGAELLGGLTTLNEEDILNLESNADEIYRRSKN